MPKPRNLTVGDVLCCRWGYDQTNVDYYQVTKLVGKTMVEIRKIEAHKVEDMSMQGWSTPRCGQFIGEPLRRKANGSSVRINSYSYAYLLVPSARPTGKRCMGGRGGPLIHRSLA